MVTVPPYATTPLAPLALVVIVPPVMLTTPVPEAKMAALVP
jgi:hypothetical protein